MLVGIQHATHAFGSTLPTANLYFSSVSGLVDLLKETAGPYLYRIFCSFLQLAEIHLNLNIKYIRKDINWITL